MSEIGTLKELNVKPGDVVEYTMSDDKYTVTSNECLIHPDGDIVYYQCWDTCSNFRIVSRAPEHKLLRDMTDAEKGALLLAQHEGKVIEFYGHYTPAWIQVVGCPLWNDDYAYRVRPEPKRVTVPLMADFKEIGTIDLVDGKPDAASIKLCDEE